MEEASTVNAPHPDDEAEAFFGGASPDAPTDPGEFEPEQPAGEHAKSDEERAAEAAEYREQKGEPEPSDPSPQAGSGGPTEPDPTPTGDGGTTGSTTEQAAPASDAPGDGGQQGGSKSGSLEREYIVFQRLPLTKRVLEHLLGQLSEQGGEPRVVYFEIDRAESRNVNGAIGAAYKKHKSRLGDRCDVAAVSSKAFQERHVEPKPVQVEQEISIS